MDEERNAEPPGRVLQASLGGLGLRGRVVMASRG